MTRTPRLSKLALLGAIMPLLGGCVAAVVPLAAGGAIIGRSDKKETVENQPVDPGPTTEVEGTTPVRTADPDPIVTVGPVENTGQAQNTNFAASDGFIVEQSPAGEKSLEEVEARDPQQQTAAVSLQSAEELPAATRVGPDFIGPPADDFPSPPKSEALQGRSEQHRPQNAGTSQAGDPQTALPAQKPSQPAANQAVAAPENNEASVENSEAGPQDIAEANPVSTDFRAYDVFYGYVEQQSRRDPVGNPRQSALLASPGSLSPRRTDCSIRPPAVLVDLDPAGSAMSLTNGQRPDPALTQILLSLRLQEIEIFWISQRPALDAGAIRRALVASGLDPQGRDGLLLMRREDDRKQIRRQELGETHCLLAIAGDERADFDELYLYLKDKSAAQPLEELIGAGWFLTPLPLTDLPLTEGS